MRKKLQVGKDTTFECNDCHNFYDIIQAYDRARRKQVKEIVCPHCGKVKGYRQ